MPKSWTTFTAIAWEELVVLARTEGGTIQYKSLEKVVGLDDGKEEYNFTGRNATRILTPILEYCQENELPILSILAHNWQGKRGSGYYGYAHRNEDGEIAEVRAHDWFKTVNPFDVPRSEAAREELLGLPAKSLNDWRLRYPGRGYQQQVFRKALLKAYRNRCALCKINHPALLEAAHLKPWNIATETERVDVRNGILLCRNHHTAWDQGLVGVVEKNGMFNVTNYRFGEKIYHLPSVLSHELRQPKEPAWRPLREWLLWRRK